MKVFLKFLGWVISIILITIITMWCYETIHMSSYDLANLDNIPSPTYHADRWDQHVSYLQEFETNEGYTMKYLDQWKDTDPVLLLVHGTPTNSWLYRKMIPWLLAWWWRVIAPDMIGFGASDKPYDMDQYTVDKQWGRLSQLVEHLSIDRYTIAWHDQWSLRVRDAVRNSSESIDHLIVFNSIADRDGFHPPAWFGRSNMMTKFIAPAMWSKGLWRLFAYGTLAWWVNDTSIVNTAMIDGYLLPLMQGTDRTYYQFISDFDTIASSLKDDMKQLSTLDITSTIIRGADDPILVAGEQVPIIQKTLNTPDENIYILKDAKHFIQEEQADEIVEIINRLVTR